jgi:murein DD-endopeptidase MepM/ murein hydrolase activator NlpD
MRYSEFGRRYRHDLSHLHDTSAERIFPGRGARIGAILIITFLALWSSATTAYLLLRDDALKFLAARQTNLVHSYDTQLTILEGEIERLKSLKLIDQERVDHAVSDLARRQAELEKRQGSLAKISTPKSISHNEIADDLTGSIPPNTPSFPAAPPKPSPISDTIYFSPPSDRSAELQSRPMISSSTHLSQIYPSDLAETRIAKLASGLNRIEAQQSQALNRLEENYEEREERLRTVLADLAVPSPAPSSFQSILSIGGPLLSLGTSKNSFEQQLSRIQSAAATIVNLSGVLDGVPVRRPVPPGAEVTSGFGVRVDPFIRQYAMHSGVDFKGEPGDAARATAAGRVTTANYQGGYGLMVELDHGNGLATRYGHLSAINVVEGQWVQVGEIVGHIGTTGRSTGPHLHYEVRVAGEAVDPQRYLRAGVRLSETM